MRIAPFLTLTAALSAFGASALACFNASRGYAGSFEKGSVQALVLFDKGREELVLMMDYRMGGEGAAPESLAWIIPTPSVPDHYDVESPKVFEDAFRLNEAHGPVGGGFGLDGRPGSTTKGSLELLTKVNVGEYEIQPIKAKGAEAGTMLAEWLKKNGYGDAAPEETKYYIGKGWTFLAVKVPKEKAAKALAKKGSLRPLRVSFAADRIHLPLKLSSGEGKFNVTLYVVTKERLFWKEGKAGTPVYDEKLQARMEKFGFAVENCFPFKESELKNTLVWTPGPMGEGKAKANLQYGDLTAFFEKVNTEGRLEIREGFIHKLLGGELNSAKNPLSGWEEDFSIPVEASGDGKRASSVKSAPAKDDAKKARAREYPKPKGRYRCAKCEKDVPSNEIEGCMRGHEGPCGSGHWRHLGCGGNF